MKTANSFSDKKTSFDYRRERFILVLTHFSFPQDDQYIFELLELYEANLVASLELKCGTLLRPVFNVRAHKRESQLFYLHHLFSQHFYECFIIIFNIN